MHSPISVAVRRAAPMVYEGVKADLRLHPYTDMSRSNVCHQLTLGLYGVLNAQQIPVRREQHEDGNGRWHYLITHAPADQQPEPDDIITDLNPWQFGGETAKCGYLHGERQEIQAAIAAAGAPEWFVGLRGIATITRLHTLQLNPHVQC